jgi:hypothetical protein
VADFDDLRAFIFFATSGQCQNKRSHGNSAQGGLKGRLCHSKLRKKGFASIKQVATIPQIGQDLKGHSKQLRHKSTKN